MLLKNFKCIYNLSILRIKTIFNNLNIFFRNYDTSFKSPNYIKVEQDCAEKDPVLNFGFSGVRPSNFNLNPWFVTGYWDGDGSFYVVLRKDKTCRFGYFLGVECNVVAEINPLNLNLLEEIQSFFGGIGYIKDKNTYGKK